MTVANATNDTRALFGVGSFAYPDYACSLSTRMFFPVSESLSLLNPSSIDSKNSEGSLLVDRIIPGQNASPQLLERFAAVSISFHSFSSWDSDSAAAWCAGAGLFESFSHDSSSTVLCVGGGLSTALSAHFISLLPDAGSSFASGGIFSVSGLLSASDWHFLPDSTAAITISAPWFYAHVREYTHHTLHAPCRCGARRSFTGACTLPLNFRRALRL